MESNILSELDLALVNALQLHPRAEWSQLAEVLGVTPATAVRHWSSLRSQGLAWIALTAGHRYEQVVSSALTLVTCDAGDTAAVAGRLADEPAVATVASTMGRHQFLLDVFLPDLASLRGYLADRLPTLPGVREASSVLITQVYRGGSQWRVGALDADQARHLAGGAQGARTPFATDALDRRLIAELTQDGRMSWADLAARCDTSPPTARRRVERLLEADVVELRCEVAQPAVGSAVQVTFLMSIPADELDAAGGALAAMPKCRLVASVAGEHNLVATMWLSGAAEVTRFEKALRQRLPQLQVADRIVQLRTVKRVGHVLDEGHRSQRVVPLAVW